MNHISIQVLIIQGILRSTITRSVFLKRNLTCGVLPQFKKSSSSPIFMNCVCRPCWASFTQTQLCETRDRHGLYSHILMCLVCKSNKFIYELSTGNRFLPNRWPSVLVKKPVDPIGLGILSILSLLATIGVILTNCAWAQLMQSDWS